MKQIVFPRIGRLRVSVNQECNLDCLYCHEEGEFTERTDRMNSEEIKALIDILNEYGIDEIKAASKEPLLYRKTPELLAHFKKIGIKKTSLTTNGILLKRYLRKLEDAGLDELSISLDALDQKTFEMLNRGKREDLEKIIEGIKMATKSKIPEVNLNMVLTSYNLKEIDKMIDFARPYNLPLRLIAFIMLDCHKTELGAELDKVAKRISSMAENTGRIIQLKRQAYTDYIINGNKITLVDNLCPDCDECGRTYALRLTSDGKLKPCLISEKGELDILTPYRKGDFELLHRRIQEAILIKKFGLIKYTDIAKKVYSMGFLPPEDPLRKDN